MSLQRWWEEVQHDLFYRTARDEAYMRHHFRLEVERSLRDIIRGQRAQLEAQIAIGRAQMEALEQGFSQLGAEIRDLQDTVQWAMESVGEAVGALERTMSLGFAQVIWQQEQTNQLLQEILKRLSSPRTTEAEEMRERGNEFYKNALNARRPEDRERWINLALDAYLEAIRKNPADFSVFYSLGVILFFEKGNSELALRCFREAAALAEPYSPYHAALAWLHLGYVHRSRKEFEEAYRATEEAIRLQPQWLEAHYQHAVHSALTGRMEEARQILAMVIDSDENYFPKAATDPDLLPFRSEVGTVLDEKLAKVSQRAQDLQRKLTRAEKVFSNLPDLPRDRWSFIPEALQALQRAQGYVALVQAIRQGEDALSRLHEPLRFPLRTLTGHTGRVWSVAFSPDGQFLASGSGDKTVKIWRVSDGKEVRTLTGHTDLVLSVAFSPDGQFLASGSDDKTVKIVKISPLKRAEAEQLLAALENWLVEQQRRKREEEEKRKREEEEKRRILAAVRAQLRKREEEERRKQEEERRRMEALRAQRRKRGLCEDCGRPLSFWDKLWGRTKCRDCR